MAISGLTIVSTFVIEQLRKYMTTINPNNNICTLINVFTVAPEKHLELFKNLREATEKVMSKFPGYISANLHISNDKKTLTNVVIQ